MPMDCSSIRDRFSDAYFSLLDEQETSEFQNHLKICASCREAYEKFKIAWEKVKKAGEATSGAPSFEKVFASGRRREPIFKRKWFVAVAVVAVILLVFTLFFPPGHQGIVMGWRMNTEVFNFATDGELNTVFRLTDDVLKGTAYMVLEIKLVGEPLKNPSPVSIRLNGVERTTILTDRQLVVFDSKSLKEENNLRVTKSFEGRLKVSVFVHWRAIMDETPTAVKK